MESSENYNFSIFKPRNLHGRKNRNVILSMLLIWAVAVFGFQILLRVIEKPTPEKALLVFEESWPTVRTGSDSPAVQKQFLNSLILARGKNTLKPDEKKVISDAITCFTYHLLPDSLKPVLQSLVDKSSAARGQLASVKGEEYLALKKETSDLSGDMITLTTQYTGIESGTLEASIFCFSLQSAFPSSMSDSSLDGLGNIIKLYMTHNRSVLTDTSFLGFPFHYFYTAVFLLILFITLCIVYNIMIEWRLKKQGIVE
jgi:uncharacterized membrane protein